MDDISTGDGGVLDEDTRQTDSADDSIDQPRRSTRQALPIKSSKFVSTKEKEKNKATISKRKSVPTITEKCIQVNRELLFGQKVKRYFTGYGGAVGTVKKYSLKQDAYYMTYADGHHEWIPFLDMLGLLPKSWQRHEAISFKMYCFTKFTSQLLNLKKYVIIRHVRRAHCIQRVIVTLTKLGMPMSIYSGNKLLTRSILHLERKRNAGK